MQRLDATKRWIVGIGLLTLLLTACGSTTAPAPNQSDGGAFVSTQLDVSYENALPARNQLLLGALKLEDSAHPLSAAQAETLLPLWQGIRATMNSGAAAQAETDALLRQIEATLSAEQLALIRGWKLTQTDLQNWARSQGIAVGNESGGMGPGQPGAGQALSAEARATRQAERGVAERGGLSRALVEAVIALLESK